MLLPRQNATSACVNPETFGIQDALSPSRAADMLLVYTYRSFHSQLYPFYTVGDVTVIFAENIKIVRNLFDIHILSRLDILVHVKYSTVCISVLSVI